jgi:hypothetical protein
MKKLYFIIFYFCSCPFLIAQPITDFKRDYQWLFGYEGAGGNPDWGFITMTFNNDTLQNITSQIKQSAFDRTNTSISDSLGNLVFYTNGIFVYDKDDELLTPDTLNPGTYAADRAESGYPVSNAALILPLPNTPHLYYLFHQRFANQDFIGGEHIEGCYYSVIDSRLRNGAGGVATWRTPIVQQDSLEFGKINACRHANGRDWWVIFWRYGYTKYRLCLLSPTGLQDYGWQAFSTSRLETGPGQSLFSPDGNRWCNSTYVFQPPFRRSRIDVLDFDRCTGNLTNYRHFFSAMDSIASLGLSISPNSRYMYASSYKKIVQYDLQASNISNSNITVANWDGFQDSTISWLLLATTFESHQLAPDGRIYISTGNGTKYLHTINNPNEAGLACNVAQHSIRLPAFNFRSIPNFPNFRLGALSGSACDTIYNSTSGSPPLGDLGGISVFPNPTNGVLNIEIPNYQNKQLFITDVLGRIEKTLSLQSETTNINISNLPNGIYYLNLYENNHFIYTTKLVVLHE